MENKLEVMFKQQQDFIGLLQELRNHPAVPLDLKDKQSQQFLRNLAYECMAELFESNLLLKNSKAHRKTEDVEFDRSAYIEELTDVLHYFFGIVICSGVTLDELFEMYIAKGNTNIDRITTGY